MKMAAAYAAFRVLQAATASRIAAIAVGRGKLLRYASAIRRDGTGFANGTDTTSRL
jgi:hypothetical protein